MGKLPLVFSFLMRLVESDLCKLVQKVNALAFKRIVSEQYNVKKVIRVTTIYMLHWYNVIHLALIFTIDLKIINLFSRWIFRIKEEYTARPKKLHTRLLQKTAFALITDRIFCGIVSTTLCNVTTFPSRELIFGRDFVLMTRESNHSFSLFL